MRRKYFILFLALVIIINPVLAYGEDNLENGKTYSLSDLSDGLRSYLLADYETGEILEEYNIDEAVEIASISKLMSFLIIMEKVEEGIISLDDVVKIDKDTTKIKGSSFKLKEGEEFTVKELLDAAIVISGNDATYALAKYVAGTEEEFVKLMNEKAKELGFNNAVFYNSTGLPVNGSDVQNKMTTREIFKLSQYIIEHYPIILDICKIKAIEVKERDFFQINTNPLLYEIKEVDGLKTGFTNKAGYCYVSTFKIDGIEGQTKDLRLIAIVMGAKDLLERNQMAKVLVEYGINNFSKKVILDKNVPLETLYFPKGDITETYVYPEEEFSKLIRKGTDITIDLDLDDIALPLKANTKVGKAYVKEDGKTIFETSILVKEDVNKAKWYVLVWRFIKTLFERLSLKFA
ncbi:MAG TPA: D-alanyl-D-alanine carboxypeptidase family protein [Tissierellaceae bacterium]